MSKPIRLAWIVDDNDIEQRHYTRLLLRSNAVESVRQFTYADDALDALIADPDVIVDALFLDINMPRMNGFEFLQAAAEQLGDRFSRVAVAIMTTSLNPADKAKAESIDVVRCFIAKPLTLAHIDAVARLVRTP